MKKWFVRCVPACVVPVMVACGGGGNPTPPPGNVAAKAGDGWVQVSWDATAGVDYWVFMAADASLTTLNWLNLAKGTAFINKTSPLTVCGQPNSEQKWLTVNGRTGGGAGGAGSPIVSVTPRAAGATWSGGTTLGSDAAAVGFAIITSCTVTGLPTGVLTAVGAGGAIYQSIDGVTWASRSAPTGFASDLLAVASYTTSIDLPDNPGIHYLALGAGGAALTSTDGVTWTVGSAFDATRPALRGLIAVTTTFTAVGDNGTIRTTSDGVVWTDRTSNTTANLRGVAYGNGRYIAVGDGGAIVTSVDSGLTWTAQTVSGAGNLRAIVYGNNFNDVSNTATISINTFVAVSDSGAVVVSSDGGVTWSVQQVAGAGELTGISYVSRFVAVDRSGNAFTSNTGTAWSTPVATGHTGLRAIVNNGYGYVAVGDGGVTTSSF